MRRNNNSGFTLIEIMVVVAIIIILAALAIPAFTFARIKSQTAVCVNNLRQIDGAYSQYVMDEGVEPASLMNLVGAALKRVPLCPIEGSYTLPSNTGGGVSSASCSIGASISAKHPHQLGSNPAP